MESQDLSIGDGVAGGAGRGDGARLPGFGDSFVYVIFADGTDLYWARSRVLEYLSQIAPRLPPQAQPALGRTPPAWAGSTNTPWWIAPAVTIWRNCAPCRTGS